MELRSLPTLLIILSASIIHENYSKDLPGSTAKESSGLTSHLQPPNGKLFSMFPNYPCGRPPPINESRCQPYSKSQYPDCQSFPGKPSRLKVQQKIHDGRPQITAKWDAPSEGYTDLWGFQVYLIDMTLNQPMMTSQCKQINFKEKGRYFAHFEGLSFGGHYELRVQSMPPDNNRSTVIRSIYIKEKCDIPELHRTKLCCQFSSVSSHINECRTHEKPIVSINVTWAVTCNTLKQFKLRWNTDDPICSGIADIKGNHTYTITLPEVCSIEQHNYTGEIYGVSAQLKTTKTERFWFTVSLKSPTSSSSYAPTSIPQSPNMKVITAVISIGIVLGIFLVVLLFMLFKFHRAPPIIRINNYSQPLSDSGAEHMLSDPVKVLILYASCCMSCKKAIYSLWDALDSTNLFDVRLDMLNEPKLNENPLRWYETQIKDAARILLVTSRLMLMSDLNPDNKQTDDYVSIRYQLNLLRGEMSNTADISKFVPVYTSYNGNKDQIPRFLSTCRSYKLPTELDKIMFHLLGMNSIRKHSRRPIVEIASNNHPFKAKIHALEKAIADAEDSHKNILTQSSTQLNSFV